ncbi:MAG: DUF1638 domain-containing protein [Bryobacteraceae bacterium]|nr:DUF1638 domain-containing protein [Bryobacteraceae bacterium]
MRLKLISCEVLFREMCDAVARSPHQVDVEFLSKGLHDLGGAAMSRELQKRVDETNGYDAVLLGYALCGNGLHGITARTTPVVAMRAHDCIALLLGSRERYVQIVTEEPGTYFRSTGWLERGAGLEQLVMNRTGIGISLDEFIERYGEDNGRYLYDEMTRYQANYSRLVYIETGLEPDASFHDEAVREAETRGWRFEAVKGSLDIFRRFVWGEWESDDFAVAKPGERFTARYDERIVTAERS